MAVRLVLQCPPKTISRCKGKMCGRQYQTSKRDKPDHIVFHVGTNDIPSGKETKDIAKLIVRLVMSAKASTCGDVSISNINTRKDYHQHKAQEVNNHLNEIDTNKNINLNDHSKNIKNQHLNKSKVHLTKSGTNILLTRMVQEI